nr:hypothetical protein [Tanacetum cinerariifolium]
MVKMVPYEGFACPCGAGDVVLRESYKPKTRGSLTPSRYSLGALTHQSYSMGTSRNAECSNCKHLLHKITVLEEIVDMYMHPEQHTVNSAALFHEVYSNMGKLDLEAGLLSTTNVFTVETKNKDGGGRKLTTTRKDTTLTFQCPILTSTNYTIWRMRMQVLLEIHGEAIETRNLGADSVKDARLQTLITEFETMKMFDNGTKDEYAVKLSGIASKSVTLGEVMSKHKLVKKFLTSLPRHFVHIVAALEQVLDLKMTGFENVEEDVAYILEVVDEVEVKDMVGATHKTKVNVTPRKNVKIIGKRVSRSVNRLYKAQLKLGKEAGKGWKIHHLDVKTDFLDSDRMKLDSTLKSWVFYNACTKRRCKESVEVSRGKDCIEIKQERYAIKILKEAGMEDCNATLCPMEPKLKLLKAKDEPEVETTQYRKMVGSLRFLLHTRPDLTYSVGVVSRYMQSLRESLARAIKQILRYFKGTTSFGIKYNHSNEMKLVGYSDSSHNVDIDDG